MSPQTKRPISAEDLYHIETISEPRIAPDGKHVVYSQQRVEKKTEKKYTNLWVASTLLSANAPRQFTYGDQSDSSPRWSPDGGQIAFLSNRGDKDKPAQIYLIPFDGGEARPLTEIEGEIELVNWSPDGRKLLCTVRKTDAEVLEREKDEQKKKLGVVSRQYDRLFYKLDSYGYLPHERTHLWLVDARTGKGKQLTEGDATDEHHPAFSPDGLLLAFISNHAKDPDLAPDRQDIFVLSALSGGAAEVEVRKVKTPIGPKTLPSFSPDGKWIAYLGHEGEGLDYRNVNLWIVPADGSKAPKNLTAQYDLFCGANIIGDCGGPEQTSPTWSPDGKFIYFQASLHGSVLLKRISVDGIHLTDVVGEGGAVGAYSFDKSHSRVAYFFGQMHDPGQIHLKELSDPSTGSGHTTRHLTRVNRALFEALELAKVEEVWFKGPDGDDLQGWIMFPPSFDLKKKYPSILEIHGGPLTQYGKTFMHEFYFLAAQGYVVYFCNPRGGQGYGEKHARSIWGAWGSVDYADLMAWADLLAKKTYIDPKRMGVTGGSYGGYMTLWIIGHTERFKAAAAQRVVSNFVSKWGSSDYNWTFEYEVMAEPPYKDFQKWWDMSPMKYIGNAKTPTMITHSENDLRCPIEQGEQAFVALKRLGVETEFIRFPDEFHGLSRTGRTDRKLARLGHIARWMDKYLK